MKSYETSIKTEKTYSTDKKQINLTRQTVELPDRQTYKNKGNIQYLSTFSEGKKRQKKMKIILNTFPRFLISVFIF